MKEYFTDINDKIVDTAVIEAMNRSIQSEQYELAEKLKNKYNKALGKNNDEIFEVIWVDSFLDCVSELESELTDDNYILFRIWCKKFWSDMIRKYFNGEKSLLENEPKNIICFQNRCGWCDSQPKYGIDMCKNCMSFRGDFEKPDLHFIDDTDYFDDEYFGEDDDIY